ncbi:MAG: hemoglobin/transferrin/lactoferrin receptor protein [Myxococcota bacterium]|jgi:hemoglobin/transferrin/lactoferrin receptor protein
MCGVLGIYRWLGLVGLCLIGQGLLGLGDAEAQYGDHYTLPPMVVTPDKGPKPVMETTRSVNSVDSARQRELQARSAPEALDESTGVFMQRTNRGAGSPVIRGLIGPQNLILVDGVPFDQSTFRTGPNQYLALLDADAIKQFEVVRGPSSVLYGNGAMGGVLQAISHAPLIGHGADYASGMVSARFGSADLSYGGAGRVVGSAGDFGFLAGGSFDQFGTLLAGGGDEVPISAYGSGGWQAQLSYAPEDEAWKLTAKYFGALVRNAGRADKLGRGEVRVYDNDDHLAYVRLTHRGNEAVSGLTATLGWHRTRELQDRFNCWTVDGLVADRAACQELDLPTLERQRRNEDIVNTVGGSTQLRFGGLPTGVLVTAGFDAWIDRVDSSAQSADRDNLFALSDQPRGTFSDGSTYTRLGLYLHTDAVLWEASSLELRANGGLRLAHFAAFAPDVPDLGDVEYDYTGVVGSLGLQLVRPGRFGVYASFVQGFRAPNLQETTGLGNTGSAFEVPNDQLRPERSNTLEVGAHLELGALSIDAAGFYTALDDALDVEDAQYQGASEVDGTPVRRRTNRDSGQILGLEADTTVRFWRLSLSAGVAWLDARVTTTNGSEFTARRTPPVFGTASLRYDDPEAIWYLEAGTRWAGAQRDLHPSDRKDLRICETADYSGVLQADCAGTDAWATVNLRAGWAFHENVRADISVTNALDTNYRVHSSGYDAPGIDARARLTSNF